MFDLMDPKGTKGVPQEVPGGLLSLLKFSFPFIEPLLKKLPTDDMPKQLDNYTENFIENWPGESMFSDVALMFASMFASNVSVSEFVSQVVEVIVEGGENPARFDTRDLEKHIDALTMGHTPTPTHQDQHNFPSTQASR